MRRMAVAALTGALVLATAAAVATAAAAATPAAAATAATSVPAGLAAHTPSPQPVPVGCAATVGGPSPGTAAPWAQQQLNFTDAWQFTRGRGVTVAVVDTGVWADRQLAGRVAAQSITGTGGLDCNGHGTGVAGLIAAAQERGIQFAGVAPAARILSIKFTDSDVFDCGLLAEGIRLAVSDHARIINVSTQCTSGVAGLADLRSVVGLARDQGDVIVAAAGNDTNSGGSPPFYPADYSAEPALYPNVLSVGAVDPSRHLAGYSDTRTNVSVVAPGQQVLTLAPGGTYIYKDGTSFAAPFVAGVAALVWASHPNLSAAQVVRRIVATADGGTGPGTGAGLVDPLQAVTAVLPDEGAAAAPVPTPALSPVSVYRAPAADRFSRVLILSITGGAFGATALVLAGAVVIPAARRRRQHGTAGSRQAPGPAAAADRVR